MPNSSASRRHFLSTTAALGVSSWVPSATAQAAGTANAVNSKWPAKPVRIVVDNKPGGGATIAIDAVAKSPADRYTLLMTTSGTVWQNSVLYTKLPYSLDKDLTPVANFPSGPLVVAVSDKVPARTMREFIEFAKTNTTSMGTYAPGSMPHMVADQINRNDGTKILPIRYRGESPMWVDFA
jgi:tripartite-type tricarboxylate transporter receptor subunit TctC